MSNSRNIRVSNLDWQIDKKSNGERAKHMFDTSLYCDCEFLVGNEEEREVLPLLKNAMIFVYFKPFYTSS